MKTGKSFLYLGNIADGAIYYCDSDRRIYLFPPQAAEAKDQEKPAPDLSLLFTAAGIFGYLLLREFTTTVTTHFSATFIFLYCLFSAIGGLGLAFMFIGFVRRRMRKNSSNFVPLEKISDDDYLLIRNKTRKQLPVVYIVAAFLLYALITEPFVWQDYVDVVTFFAYFLLWAVLAFLMYFFPPIRLSRSMKALRQIRTR